MAYEARRDDELSKEEKRARDNKANAEEARIAADVLSKSGWAPGKAIGAGFQTADKLSGGRAGDAAGALATGLKKTAPFAQKVTNELAKDDLADKAYDAYNLKNSKGASAADKAKTGTEKAKEEADKLQKESELAKKANNKGGENNSLPSSVEKNDNLNDLDLDNKKSDNNKKTSSKLTGIMAGTGLAPVLVILAPVLLFVLMLIGVLTLFGDLLDYQDLFSISDIAGLNSGGVTGDVSDPNQQAFYERVLKVKNDFQKNGKTVDPLLVVSVFHTLNEYEANISYEEITTSKITKVADAMFDNNVYSETTFKNNLKSSIIPSYLPSADSETKDAIVTEVFEYVQRYYSLIGEDGNDCSSMGSCTYNISGFNISGSNFKKEIIVNDLYVRLMQCGVSDRYDYGGTWGEPLEGEELVPFEKYVLGVAYQEIGPSAPEEAFKAQMIAARSYILARPTQMSTSTSWRKLDKENGKWILQVASCTADQVYCDPDKGCSAENGDGQGKQVYSGTNHGGVLKNPLAEDSPLRRYATQVQGEALVNNQGYIILTNYVDATSRQFASLANEGYDYKQILMEVYSNGSDIYKANCGSCVSSSDYANWKQTDARWASISLGNSSNTIGSAGCLVTSLAIQVAKSGTSTSISDFNPGTFVQELNKKGAFDEVGNYASYNFVENIAPAFKYQNVVVLTGMTRQSKLETIKNIVNQQGVYAIAEVGGASQHWVAINSVNGDTISIMDPGRDATDMWNTYNWADTSRIVYYKVG